MFPQRLRNVAKGSDGPLGGQRESSRRPALDLNLADRDVYMPRLVAVSGANVSSVDRLIISAGRS